MSYLKITEEGVTPSGKTKVFTVNSSMNGVYLGHIKWYGPFRKYAFFPHADTIFDQACLYELAHFCTVKTLEHKSGPNPT